MALDFTLPTKEQVWGIGALTPLKKYGVTTEETDLATLLGGAKSGGEFGYTSEGKLPCYAMTMPELFDREISCVAPDGRHVKYPRETRFIPVRLVLRPSETPKVRPSKERILKSGVRLVEYGEYPQTVADEKTCEKFERLRGSKFIRPTGKNYTFSSKLKSYPEYEISGKRYVRIIPKSWDFTMLSNLKIPHIGKALWVQVEPIQWLADENGTWISKKCLFSGIQFDTTERTYYDGDFSKTFMKHYLDTYFTKEIEPSKTIERIKGKKGLTALLSEQDRKEIEDDEKVTLFREAREALVEKKLKGTEKLDTKEKRKAELAILRKTNVQALRDAEGKSRAKKMASILKKKQRTK